MENETLITEYTEQHIDAQIDAQIDPETGELLSSPKEKGEFIQEDKFTSPKVRVTISEVKSEDSIIDDSL